MVYFDARLSHHCPTVEVRIADVCLRRADARLAVLVRALVQTAARTPSREPPHRRRLQPCARRRETERHGLGEHPRVTGHRTDRRGSGGGGGPARRCARCSPTRVSGTRPRVIGRSCDSAGPGRTKQRRRAPAGLAKVVSQAAGRPHAGWERARIMQVRDLDLARPEPRPCRAAVASAPATGSPCAPQRCAEIFTVADMVVEAEYPTGTLLAFNGTTEWALDSVQLDQALWLPREDQLRLLEAAFLSLAPRGHREVPGARADPGRPERLFSSRTTPPTPPRCSRWCAPRCGACVLCSRQ